MAIPTITDADTYHNARQTAAWLAIEGENDLKNGTLYRAQDYILSNYVLNTGVLNDDPAIQTAIIALAPTLITERPMTQTGNNVTMLRQRIWGSAEIEQQFNGGHGDPYPSITAMLKDVATLYYSGSGSTRLAF